MPRRSANEEKLTFEMSVKRSFAQSSRRVQYKDRFVLREVRIAVETKMRRPGLNARKLDDEPASDVLRYR
jgi:hypothetical protein